MQKKFDLKDVDAVLIYNEGEPFTDLNFFYFTGLLDSGLFEGSYYIFTGDREVIITSELEELSAKKSGMEIKIFKNQNEKDEILKSLLNNKRKIGISFSNISYKAYSNLKNKFENLEFIDITERINEMRMIKDDFEIDILKEAAKIASDVAEDIIDYIKEGMKEKELAAELTYLLMKNGAQENAFTPIIAFGENSAEPHYFSGDRKLKRGDFILMDFGARYRKYNSDITRTYFFGKANEKQRKMYEIVYNAQKIGIEMIKEGISGKDVDLEARKYIDSTEFKGLFIHSLGHGVGLAVHDHAALSPSSNLILKENMIVTVEPGVYLKGFGGVRIEDDVVVKKEGHDVISYANKELTEL
ncbi:MAG: M24 family metallopeptidase [Thermoplasmata archaeon]